MNLSLKLKTIPISYTDFIDGFSLADHIAGSVNRLMKQWDFEKNGPPEIQIWRGPKDMCCAIDVPTLVVVLKTSHPANDA